DQQMKEAVREAVQIQTDRLQDSLQRENDEFLRNIDKNMKKVLKELVKNQVKEQVSRILPRIKESVNATLEAEVLTRSSHSSRTSYAVAADLSEMELKKIFIEKIQKEGGEQASASTPSEKATKGAGGSTTGTQSQQQSASESAYAEEPVQTTCQMKETLHPVYETGTDDQPIVQTSQHPKRFSQPRKPPSPDHTLTPDLLAGPTYELMRGSCSSLTELEYHLEEVYKAKTDQLDWVNPEGQQYPHNLLLPLPLIPDNRGRRVIPFEHFINNDLEYLRGDSNPVFILKASIQPKRKLDLTTGIYFLRTMATMIEQQVVLNEALVPSAQRLRIGRSNFRLPSDIQSKESTLQVVYDVLRISPFFRAFLVTADVPEIYMQEFWATAYVHQHSIRFKMDNRKNIVDLEAFREMLHISPRVSGQSFAELPFEEEILEFLRFLGHNAQIKTLTDVNVNKLFQPWRSFAAVINKCLTGKSSGFDSLRLSQAQILWGLYHRRNIDYAFLIWEDFVYQVEHKNQKKSNEMYYPRFIKVIIYHFRAKKPSIPRRNKVNWHYVRDDILFSTIKVVSRHQNTNNTVRYYLLS
nr:hypothetical protein [Tanacetum cinerariifolium]